MEKLGKYRVLRDLHSKQANSRLLQNLEFDSWEPIHRVLDEMYDNRSEKGGRPNCDVIHLT